MQIQIGSNERRDAGLPAMKPRDLKNSAFSLVEVTLALGIAAFCLIAVFGLMPIGVQTNRNATSQTAATNIMAAVVADLRATPKDDRQLRITVRDHVRNEHKLAHCTLMALDSLRHRRARILATRLDLTWIWFNRTKVC